MKWMSYLKMGIAHWVVLLVVGIALAALTLGSGAINGELTIGTGLLLGIVYYLITWIVSGWVQPKIVANKWLNSEKLF